MMGSRSPEFEGCPQPEELTGLALGWLSAERAEEVFEHLAMCESCAQRVQSLDGVSDSIIQSLRGRDEDPYAEEAGLKKLESLLGNVAEEFASGTSGHGSHRRERRNLVPPPSKRLRDYDLKTRLGRGGMGTVYQGWHRRLKRNVAIKLFDPRLITDPIAEERFVREVEAIGQVEHPLIVRAHDAGREGKYSYLVMEFVSGLNLSQLLSRHGPLQVADAVRIVREVAIGLDFVHDRGFVHRDIKPSNVMLDEQGRVKILDLSLATLRRDWPPVIEEKDESRARDGSSVDVDEVADDSETVAETSTAYDTDDSRGKRETYPMGTADYMSPEQAQHYEDADQRSDIYSLGCMLYRLLTGRVPFEGKTVREKLQAHAHDPVPSLRGTCRDVSVELERIFQRMMSKDPGDRFQTAAEVVEQLEQLELPRVRVQPAPSHLKGYDEAEGLLEAMRRLEPSEMAGGSRRVSRASSVVNPLRYSLALSLAGLIVIGVMLLPALLSRLDGGSLSITAAAQPVGYQWHWDAGGGRVQNMIWTSDESSDHLNLLVVSASDAAGETYVFTNDDSDVGERFPTEPTLFRPFDSGGKPQFLSVQGECLVAYMFDGEGRDEAGASEGLAEIVVSRLGAEPLADFGINTPHPRRVWLSTVGDGRCVICDENGNLFARKIWEAGRRFDQDQRVDGWDEVPPVGGENRLVAMLELTGDGRYLIQCGFRCHIFDFVTETWSELELELVEAKGRGSYEPIVAVSPLEGGLVLARGNQIERWDAEVESGEWVQRWLRECEGSIVAVATSQELGQAVLAFPGGRLEWIDLATARTTGYRQFEMPFVVEQIALSPSGLRTAVLTNSGQLFTCDAPSR